MEDSFELPVDYKGTKYLFKAALKVYGFTHKFNVDVNGQTVILEPDEAGKYRIIINSEETATNKPIGNIIEITP